VSKGARIEFVDYLIRGIEEDAMDWTTVEEEEEDQDLFDEDSNSSSSR